MVRSTRNWQIVVYETREGQRPFWKWLKKLRDRQARIRIKRRLDRFASGNFGDHKSVGEGVWEMRLFFGAGYRIYFANYGESMVVLLLGGDKRAQEQDILKAKSYWADFKSRNQ